MIYLVPCFILEHLCQQLSWGNIRVKFFFLALNWAALVFEYHWAAPLTVLELNIVTHKSLAVDKSCSEIVGLIYVLRVWTQRWVRIRLIAISGHAIIFFCRFILCGLGITRVPMAHTRALSLLLYQLLPHWRGHQKWLELVFVDLVRDQFCVLTRLIYRFLIDFWLPHLFHLEVTWIILVA